MKLLRLPAAAAFAALLCGATSAQGVLYRIPDLGDVVAGPGDLDGDGHPEILVGRSARFGFTGEIRLISVVDGSTFRSHAGSQPDDGFATAAAALGDVDGDGVGDYAFSITGGPAPAVRIHSGATGLLVRAILPPASAEAFGTVLEAGGDVDGDQVRDLLVTSGGSQLASPAVWVFSGQSGALLRAHVGASAWDLEFGCALSILGDTDGDGRDDYAIGNSRRSSNSLGEVHVISGATGAWRYTLSRPQAPPDGFGEAISRMQDVDLDGYADLVIGAPDESHGQWTSGMVLVHSGFDGHQLARVYSNGGIFFGQSVLGIDDYDGDGTPDFVGFAPYVYVGGVVKNFNRAMIYSGNTGALIEWLVGSGSLEGGGMGPLIHAGDLNSDGQGDWLLGAAGFVSLATAILRDAPQPVHSSAWQPACQNFAHNSLGCIPAITWSGASSMSVGPEPQVTSTKLVPNTVGLLLWGASRASTPFGGGSLCVGAPVHRTPGSSTGGTAGTCNGSISYTFARSLLASHGLTVGSELVVQSWSRDPGLAPPADRNLTPAVAIALWP